MNSSTFASSTPVCQPSEALAALQEAADQLPLLLPVRPESTGLDIDLFQRYAVAARLIARMLARVRPPVRILELGPNYLNPLPLFLDPQRVRLTLCDVQPTSADPRFIRIDPDQPLPFTDESFDAVLALEVLEHMPAERRRPFLGECLRVARHGAVFSCPNGHPAVIAAEELAAESYSRRHGTPHPYLQEHRAFGLPQSEEVVALLRELDVPHAVFDNAPLDLWLGMILLNENLLERRAPAQLLQLLNQCVYRGSFGTAVPYRKVYVCAKTFDATAALEPTPQPTPDRRSELEPGRDALHHLAVTSAEALSALAQSLRAKEADGERTQSALSACEQELFNVQRRQYTLHAYLKSWSQSTVGKGLGLASKLLRLVKSCGFDKRALIPWKNLEPEPRNGTQAWQATGPDAHFLVPCELPAGLVFVRIQLTSDVLGQAQLAFNTCGDGDDSALVERLPVHGRLDHHFFLYLHRPVFGFHFFPLTTPGKFWLQRLQVTSLSKVRTLPHAVRVKIALLRQYGLLARALSNGAGLLWRGHFREFVRKLHGGLDWSPEDATGNPETSGPAVPAEPQPQGLPCVPQHHTGRAGDRRRSIVYVLRSAGICGGVKVVLEHCARLHARGHNVSVYYLENEQGWFTGRVPAYRFADLPSLKQALARFRGIKVATWYETAPWVAESLQAGDRGYYLVQDIEDSYAMTPEAAAAALESYSLGLKPITEGVWVRDQLRQRWGLDSVFVSIGLDLELFRPRRVLREPQRLLTPSRTWSGGGAAGPRLKGWKTARATILRCHRLNPALKLTTFSIEDPPVFPPPLDHVHHRTPSDEQLAELYSQAGVYLLTSNHEGFGLTAAEAMACGCPVVATRAQGNEEHCIDGVTALLADAGNAEQLAQHIVRLQADPALARELGLNGRRFILNYTWDRVIDRLEREFLQEDGPEIVIEPPERRVAVMPFDADARHDFRAADPSLAPLAAACRKGGEYPDLQFDEPPVLDWSVVIPTLNEAALVTRCIDSCRGQVPPNTSIEFIVVDDGTTDAAVVQQLRRAAEEHDFTLLFNHQNLGFSATVNYGMRHARGRCVVLCNNDIEFFQPWLEPLEQLFAANPRLGIVGAKLLYPNGSIQHAGLDKGAGEVRWYHTHCHQPGNWSQANQSRHLWGVTGALCAVRRETLDRLGGFSTGYGMGCEDLDYCLYAWSRGVHVGYCSDVVAYHVEGGTRGATPAQKEERPSLWLERERAGWAYFEQKWAFLRHVENYQALVSLLERPDDAMSLSADRRQPALLTG